MPTSTAGVAVIADTRGLTRLGQQLRAASPEAWKSARVALRAAAQLVAATAKSNASWSSTIPGTIRVMGSGFRIRVVADGSESVVFEVGSKRAGAGTIRHPVLNSKGNPKRTGTSGQFLAGSGGKKYDRATAHWSEMPSRPYLAPAMETHIEEIVKAVEDATYGAVCRAIGAV